MDEKKCVLYGKICVCSEIAHVVFSYFGVMYGIALIVYLVLGGSML